MESSDQKPSKEELADLYLQKGNTLSELGIRYQCSGNTIKNWLKGYGIPLRTLSETRLNSIRRGRVPGNAESIVNENFFSEWSAPMAWVLGLLYTDGYMPPRGNTIQLALKDRDILEKVMKAMGANREIREERQSYDQSQLIYMVSIHRKPITDDLKKLGISSNKSLSIILPELPHKYINHFIRGCWDGDGGFTFSGDNQRGETGVAHYTCGSYIFIKRIQLELFRNGIFQKSIHRRHIDPNEYEKRKYILAMYPQALYPPSIYKRRNAKAYDLRIAGTVNLCRLYSYLYGNCGPEIRSDRKYALLENFLNDKVDIEKLKSPTSLVTCMPRFNIELFMNDEQRRIYGYLKFEKGQIRKNNQKSTAPNVGSTVENDTVDSNVSRRPKSISIAVRQKILKSKLSNFYWANKLKVPEQAIQKIRDDESTTATFD